MRPARRMPIQEATFLRKHHHTMDARGDSHVKGAGMFDVSLRDFGIL